MTTTTKTTKTEVKETHRVCIKCAQVKPIEKFEVDNRRIKENGDNRTNRCYSCKRASESPANTPLSKMREHAKENNSYVEVTAAELEQLMRDYDDTCAYCLKKKGDGDPTYHIEHVFPRSHRLGMTHSIDNLVISCKSCNARKGTKSVMQFFRDYDGFTETALQLLIAVMAVRKGVPTKEVIALLSVQDAEYQLERFHEYKKPFTDLDFDMTVIKTYRTLQKSGDAI